MYGDKYWNERYKGEDFLYGIEPNLFSVEYSKGRFFHCQRARLTSNGVGRSEVAPNKHKL